MFEVTEFREPAPVRGVPHTGTELTVLGSFESEEEAINVARSAWTLGRTLETTDVMWWVVRVPGEQLSRWIADRASEDEQILDLTTGTLVAIR